MEIPVNHPRLESQQIAVRTAKFFRGPRLVVNGVTLRGSFRTHKVTDPRGEEVQIRLRPRLFDSVPSLKVNEEGYELAPPLTWSERLWALLPLLLVFVGGALGGLIGGGAAYANVRIFRSDRSTIAKYALTALLSIGAVLGFFVIMVIFQILWPDLYSNTP